MSLAVVIIRGPTGTGNAKVIGVTDVERSATVVLVSPIPATPLAYADIVMTPSPQVNSVVSSGPHVTLLL